MWATARATEAFRAAIAGATNYRREIVRLFGIPESEIANTLRAAEDAGWSSSRWRSPPACAAVRSRSPPVTSRPRSRLRRADRFIAERHGDTLFSRDGSTIDEQVAGLLAGHTLATAESCTGGGCWPPG